MSNFEVELARLIAEWLEKGETRDSIIKAMQQVLEGLMSGEQ